MSIENISLRPATADDWRSIASLLHENQLPLEGAEEHLADFVIAATDGIIVGCAGLEVREGVALLRSVAVAPLLHGRGVGKMLVNRMIHEATKRRIVQICLLTVGGQEFFAQFGFRAEAIDAAPDSLRASAEFQGACPSSAEFMSLYLVSWKWFAGAVDS